MLISGIQQSDSVTHICMFYICIYLESEKGYMYTTFQILFHYRLLQDTEYRFLCYRSSLFICFIYSSVYLLIPNS